MGKQQINIYCSSKDLSSPFQTQGTLGAGHEAVMPVDFPLTSEHLFDMGCKFCW